jgi:hypothetical protein
VSKAAKALNINILPVLVLVWVMPVGVAQDAGRERDKPSAANALTAISAPDNDFSIEDDPKGKRVAVPDPVAKVIHLLAEAAFEEWKKEGDTFEKWQKEFNRPISADGLVGPIFRIMASDERSLFVFRREEPYGLSFYFFIMFDPRTGAVTKDPPSICGKWMDGFVIGPALLERPILQKPLASFLDLDRDGKLELVVQEQVHNGTLYNAVVYHYFRVLPDLSLRRALALETRFRIPDPAVEIRIIRTVRAIGKNTLRLNAVLEWENGRVKRRRLGYAILSRPRVDSPFQVVAKRVLGPRYREWLITACDDTTDNHFLRDGCSNY